MALRGSASQANTTSQASVTITHGISIQQNDIILLYCMAGGGGTQTLSYPSGFATTGLSNLNLNSGGQTYGVQYKVAGASEPSSYTVTPAITDFHSLHIRVYSGRNTSSPLTAVQATGPVALATTPINFSTTGLTPASGDDIVLVTGLEGAGGASQSLGYTPPSGFGNGGSFIGLANFTKGGCFCDKLNTSGSTGTLGGSLTLSSPNNAAYGTFLISLAVGAVNTGITPTVGAVSVNGVASTVTPVQNTQITPFVARKSGLLEPDRELYVPDRRIFLPTYHKRAA